MDKVAQLVDWINESNYTVVLTGAGMSTESGIPDFRSENGWWRNIDPQLVANIDALNKNYNLFHEFYSMRLKHLKDCYPHEGHDVLAKLEQVGKLHFVATQNVDGFHRMAGNQNVAELHGNIHQVRCQHCGQFATEKDFIEKLSCSSCGGKLRPGVVLFGEFLPEKEWEAALKAIQRAQLVIVIGTSLQVSPVNQLPVLTTGKKVYVNLEIEGNNHFDLVIKGSAKRLLTELEKQLNL